MAFQGKVYTGGQGRVSAVADRKAVGVKPTANKGNGEWTQLETYGAKIPEEVQASGNFLKKDGTPMKFVTIAEKSQHSNGEYPSFSINMGALERALAEGILTVNEKGYISGLNVFTKQNS